jgi:prephenate dehydrogenase
VATRPGSGAVVAVVGVGLMGGSLGLAARELAGVRRVVGYSRSPETVRAALELGAITEAAASLEEAASAADLVFICTPVRLVVSHVRRAHAVAGPDAVVSDVGSTKAMLMDVLTPDEQRRCVGGHPLCGSETAGVRNARASLYEGATYFLTPGAHVGPAAFQRLYDFLLQIGARPVAVEPHEHDRVLALVSHLPHVLANVLMTQAGEHEGSRDALLCAGPSFRDMTRIAGSNARVWADIFLENRTALLAALHGYRDGLDELASALEAADEERLTAFVGRAARQRERLLAAESLSAEKLFRVMVKLPDRPGQFQRITVALGDAAINIEDIAMHHMSAELGGELTVYVLGAEVCERAATLLEGLGYQVTTGRGVQ